MVDTAEVGQDLDQGIDLVFPAHRAQFQKGEAGVHGQHHDGAQQDEKHIAPDLNASMKFSSKTGNPEARAVPSLGARRA
jgi:hypothetical protein